MATKNRRSVEDYQSNDDDLEIIENKDAEDKDTYIEYIENRNIFWWIKGILILAVVFVIIAAVIYYDIFYC